MVYGDDEEELLYLYSRPTIGPDAALYLELPYISIK